MEPLVALVALAGIGCGVWLATPGRHGLLDRLIGGLLAFASTALLLATAAIATDYRDSDGFTDCWPRCSTWQEIVQAAFWWGGLLFVVLIVTIAVQTVIKASVRK